MFVRSCRCFFALISFLLRLSGVTCSLSPAFTRLSSSSSSSLALPPLLFSFTLLLSCVAVVRPQAVENSNASRLDVSKSFTFASPDSRIVLGANGSVAQRLITSKREISFDFRTRHANGIILFETFATSLSPVSPPSKREYSLLLALRNGQFNVLLEYEPDKQAQLTLGRSFNRDQPYRVVLYVNPELGFLNILVNGSETVKYYKSLYFNSTFLQSQTHPHDDASSDASASDEATTDTTTSDRAYTLSLGGLPFSNESSFYRLNGYTDFVGCVGNLSIVSRSNVTNFGTLSQSRLSQHAVQDGCVDQCALLNLCSRRSRCVNYYDSKLCDCFRTELEDWHCRSFNYTVLTLRGHSSISYQVYRHHAKTYSDEHTVSLHLKTKQDALLFVALAEASRSYLILSIKNGFLHVLFSLGNNPRNFIFNDFKLTDDKWHNLTVSQKQSKFVIDIDVNTTHVILLEERDPYFYFDPEIHIGGFPPTRVDLSRFKLPIAVPNKRFVGCLKHVYFNHINVLYELHRGHPEAKYHGFSRLEIGCHPIDFVPITVQPNSYFRIATNQTSLFELHFDFRTTVHPAQLRLNSKIANGTFVTSGGEKRKWYLLLRKLDVKLWIEQIAGSLAESRQIGWTLSCDGSLNITTWNAVRIVANVAGFFTMTVNEYTVIGRYDSPINRFNNGQVFIGSIDSRFPFAGCVRNVRLNALALESRLLPKSGSAYGRISLDDCRLLDPCDRPDACEHGGVCVPIRENGTFVCDCANTGYFGKTCHFSVYRKSCEEIYLMDKRHSGIFMIDIDRNGPLPPAHVVCNLIRGANGDEDDDDEEDDDSSSSSSNTNSIAAAAASATTTNNNNNNNNNNFNNNGGDSGEPVSFRTVIEHNIQHQMIVREKGQQGNYMMDVVYRDFRPEMLRLLVRRADRCEQYVKYECNEAPLNLGSYTFLYSTQPDAKVMRIDGSRWRGCRCGGTPNTCVDSRKQCNCDATQIGGWKHDEGVLTSPDDVAITKMFFLQPPNMTRDSEAHLFLGNLSCIDTDTQRYHITFKTKQSYLQVPGWSGRELGISFRTTANKAVIFYQSHFDSTDTYFKAVIISETEVRFEYSLLGRKHSVTVASSHCLNCGQWQHIWIERHQDQMRVSINQVSRVLYLPNGDEFIDFDGKLFVGGAPLEYLKGLKITFGYIGCLRGLVFDNEVINLHDYLDSHRKPNIESGCRPYCKANLCQNQGHCVEKWGSYECRCANPIAHSGRNCEININENSITFKKPASIRQQIESMRRIKAILYEDIIFSFRTHARDALLLYAHDVYNNFAQIHIENGTKVVFTFNWLRRIVRRDVTIGSPLVSGQIIQVHVDRSHKNSSTFVVNQKSIFIPYPVTFLKNINADRSWLAGQEFEIVKLNRATNWTHNELYIGGLRSREAESALPGFVGCMQGLKVGDDLIDLRQIGERAAATMIESDDLGDLADRVVAGCAMRCDAMPCKNGGICTEVWGESATRCDCGSTSYRGDFCDIDIGAYFHKNSSVLYYLENDVILDFNTIEISFAFSSGNFENSTLFLLRYANSTRFLHIALLADGRLMVEEDNGHDVYISIIASEDEDTFLDSHRHWVHYIRKDGSAQVIVDSLIYIAAGTSYLDTLNYSPQISENVILIGSNRIAGNAIQDMQTASFSSFKGCLSNIDVQLDDFRIDPFESAFGIRSGLNKVKVNGDITQSRCASFQTLRASIALPVDRTVTLTNLREIWLNRPKPALVRYDETTRSDQMRHIGSYTRTEIVMTLCIGYLLIVGAIVGVYLYRVDKHYRLLKFQGETPFFHKKPLKPKRSHFVMRS